ncbi:MAG: IMP cyclohydrolase [Spirochaetaceae bacterium]|nr:MAG: IMP cyclohydrolase [Spirochaetaceae bacterium]
MAKDFKAQYKTIVTDHFPPRFELSFDDGKKKQTLVYEKVTWTIEGETLGLRYGENPTQEAVLYKLVNGNLTLGEVEYIKPGKYLVSDVQLIQSGKHPGKINMTDVDSALGILKYLHDSPCTAIVKHNNPSGVARSSTLVDSFQKAYLADRIAAFGGAVALNRTLDMATTEKLLEEYFEVVVAPDYEEGVLSRLAGKKNLRIMKIKNMDRLSDFAHHRFVDFKSLQDGGIIAQVSFKPEAITREKLLPATASHKGTDYKIKRMPTDKEYDDLIFGWIVESGVTSNSVLYVKDGVTVGIGTGEQDRVGVAEIARDKAYKKCCERLSALKFGKRFSECSADDRAQIEAEVKATHGGLAGSVMISDAFFPFRDTADVAIKEGVTAIIQPGGAIRDFESIEACNEANVAMVFTGERSFKH